MANYYERLLATVNKLPNHPAFEFRRTDGSTLRYNYAEFRAMADAVAHWVVPNHTLGDRIAILAGNRPRWCAVYWGIMGAGCITVPLDVALHAPQVRKLLVDSGARTLFTDPRHHQLAEEACAGLEVRILSLEADLDEMIAASRGEFAPVQVDPHDIAAILYSSGTTGDPKGVMLTHDNFAAETELVFDYFPLGSSDALLGILPLFHALAQVTNLLVPIAAGSKVVFLETLNTTELLKALQDSGVSLFVCVPQFFYLIHERIQKQVAARGRNAQRAFSLMMALSRAGNKFGLNLGKVFFKKVHAVFGPSLRLLVTGGSKFDAQIGRDFQAMGFTIAQAFGLTETSGGATCTPLDDVEIASVGRPLRGVEAKIAPNEAADAADHSSKASGHKVGEICLRGRIVMKGYWNRPDATAEALRDGWLHTGDLGYIDAKGNVFITGRAKEVIVLANGKNIYPEEIEAHYSKSPWIKEIAVLGVEARPGEPAGERLHGIVVPNFELLREKKIVNTREVIRFDIETLSTQIAASKRILSYDIWQDELPRTTTRKLKRFEIERMARERGAVSAAEAGVPRALSAEDQAWMTNADVQRGLTLVRDAAKSRKNDIYPGDNLELDLGLDSMERVELLVALERELDAYVDESRISEIYTVRDLIETVRSAKGAGARAKAPAWDAVLREEPTEPEVLAIAKRRPVLTLMWYVLGRIALLFARLAFRLRVEGRDKLPKNGPFILSPNHQSFLDPPVIVSMLPWRVFKKVFYVGASDIFGEGMFRVLARSLKLIPVDPDANLVPAMRAGAFGLRKQQVLVLYPEGERSIDGTPKVFKKGAAILAHHLRVPIVPVAMEGFHEAWPRGQAFRRFARLKVVIGDPIAPPPETEQPERAYEKLTADLRSRVVGMWERLHREMYPESEAVGAD